MQITQLEDTLVTPLFYAQSLVVNIDNMIHNAIQLMMLTVLR